MKRFKQITILLAAMAILFAVVVAVISGIGGA